MKKVTLIILCLCMFLIGLLTSQVFQIEKVNAAKTIEYKVVVIHYSDAESLERLDSQAQRAQKQTETLNTYAKQGWKLHSADDTNWLILER